MVSRLTEFEACVPHEILRVRARHDRRKIGLLLVAFCSLFASTASAIEISDYKWGFNGKVSPHRFNLLSVLVNNPTPQQFTGEIRLRKSLGGAGTVDATIVESITVSPNAQKWVQFYPYISSDGYNGRVNENWHLSYPGGNYDLPEPRIAKYQRVIFDDPNSVMAKGGAIKFRFPDNLFPPFVTATDALQVAILDHVPRWEESRRQAFLDWLYMGGTAVVLYDNSGKFPDFTGPLSVLKTPLDDQLYGSGRVIQFPRTRSQFQEDDFRQICSSLPKNYQPPNGEKSDDYIDHVDETQQLSQAHNYNFADSSDVFRASTFLSQLRQMTKPDHNWFLLHFMFWVYIGLIFPGCYLLGKRWTDFRIVYAGLLGTVVLFSILFSYVGQRGYGEATAVHTMAIARTLPDGQMDVSSWSNIFVTAGADYDVQYNGTGALFSTCSDHEQVKGEINNGVGGMFRVDIPPFSNREMAVRVKIPFENFALKIDEATTTDGHLAQLQINVSGIKQDDVEKQVALIGNLFYELNWRDGKLVLGKELGNVSTVLNFQQLRNSRYGFQNRNTFDMVKQTQSDRYRQMFDMLLARGANVNREKEAEQLRLPGNLIRVFLIAKIPGEFAVQNTRLSNQEGRVLYCVTLSPTEAAKR